MASDAIFDEEVPDFEGALTKRRDEHLSPLVLLGGLAGMAAGVFLWGSLLVSMTSMLASGFDELGSITEFSEGAVVSAASDTPTPTPSPSPTPRPTATPTPDPSVNRLNCQQIRGTDYRSPEERTWFLANCVTR